VQNVIVILRSDTFSSKKFYSRCGSRLFILRNCIYWRAVEH
jgi:hypothetical protein